MPKAFCVTCSNAERGDVDFPTVRELNEHMKNGHPLPVSKEEAPQVIAQPSPQKPEASKPAVVIKKEIVLLYKYDGICTSCDRELDTIKLEMADHHIMIAYCPNCRVQYKQKKVIPIEKQFNIGERKLKKS